MEGYIIKWRFTNVHEERSPSQLTLLSPTQGLLITPDFSPTAVYKVTLFDVMTAAWRPLYIDDRVPAGGSHAVAVVGSSFSRSRAVQLLVKAFAKLSGSYGALAGGNAVDALQRMIGGRRSTLTDVSGLLEEAHREKGNAKPATALDRERIVLNLYDYFHQRLALKDGGKAAESGSGGSDHEAMGPPGKEGWGEGVFQFCHQVYQDVVQSGHEQQRGNDVSRRGAAYFVWDVYHAVMLMCSSVLYSVG